MPLSATEAFRQVFDTTPTHVARAPGRVNLIGEHIDYAGLSVLPMALPRSVRLALRPRPDTVVRLANVDPAFARREFTVAPDVEPFAPGDWGNYGKAAVAGLARRFGALHGLDGVVASDLPVAAGLSSSSALVVATALGLLAANGRSAAAPELMELLARAERYVGTEGGGMDQAICLGAERGCAMRIDFGPLRLTALSVPPSWRFVVADSLMPAAKSGAAREAYNRRRQECEQALARLIAHLGLGDAVASYSDLSAARSAENLLATADRALQSPWRERFRHVVTEARRVGGAAQALAADDSPRFGRLMDESHRSLAGDFAVSSAELDRLADHARAAGALGARLTGAGFGGSIVALASADTVDGVLDGLARYYDGRRMPGELSDHLFVAEPAAGASVTTL